MQQEGDVVLRVNLDDNYRFLVLVKKDSSVKQLKTEIVQVARALSIDIRELTSIQSANEFELPDIYPVGRLLKEKDIVLAYSNRFKHTTGNSSDANKQDFRHESVETFLPGETGVEHKDGTSISDHVPKNVEEEDNQDNNNDEHDCNEEEKINESEDVNNNRPGPVVAEADNREQNVQRNSSSETNPMECTDFPVTTKLNKENVAGHSDAQLEKDEVFEEHSSLPKEVTKKPKKRIHRHSRTEPLDESLTEEQQRNKPSDSASNASPNSSSISGVIFNSTRFRALLQSKEYRHSRRKVAVEKSVTKVASWLVESEENDAEITELPRNESEVDNSGTVNSQEMMGIETSGEKVSRNYVVIDIMDDSVMYFDSVPSQASHSEGCIKKSSLLSCSVVIPKLVETPCKGYTTSVATMSQSSTANSQHHLNNQSTVVSTPQGTTSDDVDHINQSTVVSRSQATTSDDVDHINHEYRNESQDNSQSPTKPPSCKKDLLRCNVPKIDEDNSCCSTEILEHVDDVHKTTEKLTLPQEISNDSHNDSNQKSKYSHAQPSTAEEELQSEVPETEEESSTANNTETIENRNKYSLDGTSLCGLTPKKKRKEDQNVSTPEETPTAIKPVDKLKKRCDEDNLETTAEDELTQSYSLPSTGHEVENSQSKLDRFSSSINANNEATTQRQGISQQNESNEEETLLKESPTCLEVEKDIENQSNLDDEHNEESRSKRKDNVEHSMKVNTRTESTGIEKTKNKEKELQETNSDCENIMTKTVDDQQPSHTPRKHRSKHKKARENLETQATPLEEDVENSMKVKTTKESKEIQTTKNKDKQLQETNSDSENIMTQTVDEQHSTVQHIAIQPSHTPRKLRSKHKKARENLETQATPLEEDVENSMKVKTTKESKEIQTTRNKDKQLQETNSDSQNLMTQTVDEQHSTVQHIAIQPSHTPRKLRSKHKKARENLETQATPLEEDVENSMKVKTTKESKEIQTTRNKDKQLQETNSDSQNLMTQTVDEQHSTVQHIAIQPSHTPRKLRSKHKKARENLETQATPLEEDVENSMKVKTTKESKEMQTTRNKDKQLQETNSDSQNLMTQTVDEQHSTVQHITIQPSHTPRKLRSKHKKARENLETQATPLEEEGTDHSSKKKKKKRKEHFEAVEEERIKNTSFQDDGITQENQDDETCGTMEGQEEDSAHQNKDTKKKNTHSLEREENSLQEKNTKKTSLEESVLTEESQEVGTYNTDHTNKKKKKKRIDNSLETEHSLQKDKKRKTKSAVILGDCSLRNTKNHQSESYKMPQDCENDISKHKKKRKKRRKNKKNRQSSEENVELQNTEKSKKARKKKTEEDSIEREHGTQVKLPVESCQTNCLEENDRLLNDSSESQSKRKKKKTKHKSENQEGKTITEVGSPVMKTGHNDSSDCLGKKDVTDSNWKTALRKNGKRKHSISNEKQVDGNGASFSTLSPSIECDTPKKKSKHKKHKNQDNIMVDTASQELTPEVQSVFVTPNKVKKSSEKKQTNLRHAKTYHDDTQVLASQVSQDSGMFTSDSESDIQKEPINSLLSWIEKISDEKTPKTNSRNTKLKLLDLVQDAEDDSVTTSSTRNAVTPSQHSLNTQQLFHKAPKGFTNTVPRVKKKSRNLVLSSDQHKRRPRNCGNDISQTRELTAEEQEMLSGGVSQLDTLLTNDSFWTADEKTMIS